MSTDGAARSGGNFIEMEMVDRIDAISIGHLPIPRPLQISFQITRHLACLAGRIEGAKKERMAPDTIARLEHEFACFRRLEVTYRRIAANQESFLRWFAAHKPARPDVPPKEEQGDAA